MAKAESPNTETIASEAPDAVGSMGPVVDPRAVLAEREPEPWPREPEQKLPRDEYLSLRDGDHKLRIYRCRVCAVRVADEADVAEHLPGDRLRFSRVRNIDRDTGKCARCGAQLQPSEREQCGLQMYLSDGEQAFALTSLRVIVFLELDMGDMATAVDLVDPETGEAYADGRFALEPITTVFAVLNQLRGGMFEDLMPAHEVDVSATISGINPFSYTLDTEVDQPLRGLFEGVARDQGLEAFFKACSVKRLGKFIPHFPRTTDFALIIKGTSSKKLPLRWTGVSASFQEALLAEAWRASGGNMLFANWGAPYHADTFIDKDAFVKEMRGELWRGSDDPRIRPAFRRLREIDGENYGLWESNNQLGLADLAEQGHYLYWWAFGVSDIPDEAKEKIAAALRGELFADGRWRGLVDLPKAFFEPQVNKPYSEEKYQARPVFDFTDPVFNE